MSSTEKPLPFCMDETPSKHNTTPHILAHSSIIRRDGTLPLSWSEAVLHPPYPRLQPPPRRALSRPPRRCDAPRRLPMPGYQLARDSHLRPTCTRYRPVSLDDKWPISPACL